MVNATWFGSLVIPIMISLKIGADWKKAKSLSHSIPEKDIFDKFKNGVLDDNKQWASIFFFETIFFALIIGGLLILYANGAIPESALPPPVSILTLSLFIFLIGDIIFVKNDIMKDLKDKALVDIISNKKTFEDFQQMLITSYKLQDTSLKDNFDEYLIKIIKKNSKKKK